MPDWTYRTLFRGPLLRLPFRTARALAFGGLGTLAKIPGGVRVVDFFGHMAPPRDLAVMVDGVEYRSPVGLGPLLDPQQQALAALGRFGVGWVEIDPRFAAIDAQATIQVDASKQVVSWRLPTELALDELAFNDHAFQSPSPALPVPHWLRIHLPRVQPVDEARLRQLRGSSALAFTIALQPELDLADWQSLIAEVVSAVSGGDQPRPVYIVAPIELSLEEVRAPLVAAIAAGAKGVVIARTVFDAASAATEQLTQARELVKQLREGFGGEVTIVVAAGIQSPAEAIECWRAGATLVQVDCGLVFAGPGLPKRVCEARRFQQSHRRAPHPAPRLSPPAPSPALPRAVERAWFWLLLLGLAMFFGGVLAGAIAATRVVLPYDEAYLGLTRAQIAEINPRLLLFMAHDRVTLAGTMLAIGVFYSFLAWHAVRHGSHWAWLTILTSALSGFASFFLFLFFGYFDPFHALVTAILFQLLLAGWQSKLDPPAVPQFPNLGDTRAWRLCQWAQLLFVAQGVALIVGGCAICYIGSTTVFVPEDLEFMQTSRAILLALHPRLVPVVAHDRASFGGMLIACGLATLLSALWGFRQGDSWQWWMYLLAGTLAYGSTLIVHVAVGYHSPWHLAPALAGCGVVIAGLILSYPYLMGLDIEHYRRWKQLLAK